MPKIDKRASKTQKTAGSIYKRAERKPKTPKNKGFEYYHNLPAELRMMVVDEMKPDDRCRFSQVSYLSSMEAKRSKNSMYSLGLYCLCEHTVLITVSYDSKMKCGYHLIFKKDSNRKYIQYTNLNHKELWRTELPDSTDLVQFAAEHFKNVLRDHQNNIKVLKIQIYVKDKLKNFDFEIKHFNNLEWLETRINSSILPVISKLRRPLKTLIVYGEENNQELQNYEISRISERIDLPHFKLNYKQFLELSASYIAMNIGGLTEENVYKIIKNWQNQATEGKTTSYDWNLEGSKFNIPKLLRLLRAEDPNTEEEILMEIKHGFEKDREALLVLRDGCLIFETDFQ